MTATVVLPTESFDVGKLCRLAERDQLAKADRLSLYKVAANCGEGTVSIHGSIFDWWAHFDKTIFNRQLSPVLIVIGVTEHSGCLGSCTPVAGQSRITLHQACYAPALTTADKADIEAGREPLRWGMPRRWMGEMFLADVLLHEMMHSAQADLGLINPLEDAHHCSGWANLCNHVAKHIGLSGTWFPVYKRGKVSIELADGTRKRVNKWKIANPEQQPKGTRVASREEVSAFPHATFAELGLADVRYGS